MRKHEALQYARDKARHEALRDLRRQVAHLVLPAARLSRDASAIGYEHPDRFHERMAATGATWSNFGPGREHPHIVATLPERVVYAGRRLQLSWLPEDVARFALTLVWEPRQPYSPLEQLALQAGM